MKDEEEPWCDLVGEKITGSGRMVGIIPGGGCVGGGRGGGMYQRIIIIGGYCRKPPLN